jgi:hypothetical protein
MKKNFAADCLMHGLITHWRASNAAESDKLFNSIQKLFLKTVFYSSRDASLAEILFLYDTQSNILAPFR